MTNNAGSRPFLLIVFVATLAVAPMLIYGNVWGHDFDFHFPTWVEAEQQLRQGVLYPHWAALANYGFGEPFFIFDPPIPRTLGVILGLILPWRMVPGAYIWLVCVLAGVAMWKLAADWLAPSDAIVASLIYAWNPFLIARAYKSCNYAELMASALFPLLVWGALRIGRGERKAILPLMAVFGAIWLSDLPAGLVASYALAGLLVIESLIHRSWRPLFHGGIAIVGGFGAIAGFLLPAAVERKWVTINSAVRWDWAPENNFLFSRNNTPQMLAFNRGISFIAVVLILSTAIAAVLTYRSRKQAPATWYSVVALGAISTFLMFRWSSLLWRLLPDFRFLQFPWRWLLPLCVVTALLIPWAIARSRKKWVWWTGVAVIVAAIGAQVIHTAHWNSEHLGDVVAAVQSGSGYDDLANYLWPIGSDPSMLPASAPLVAASSPDEKREVDEIHVESWLAERRVFSVTNDHPLLLKPKLLTYPAWQARVNSSIVSVKTDPKNGQMLLRVPAGSSRVEISFVRTWDRTTGEIVSLATLLALALAILFVRWQRGQRSRQS